MKEEMKNKIDDEYKVIFGGATISSKEAKKVGVALIFGFIGILVIGLSLGLKNKLAIFVIAFILACVGYFGIANKIFKKTDR
jgi:hypothetical protein